MRRTEENETLRVAILKDIQKGKVDINAMHSSLLADISQSLAVIADALSERRAEQKDEISKSADKCFEKLFNGEFGEGGPHAND